jgi:hypothetical protein
VEAIRAYVDSHSEVLTSQLVPQAQNPMSIEGGVCFKLVESNWRQKGNLYYNMLRDMEFTTR